MTYGDAIGLHFDGEDLEIHKLPPAHTDGDSYIRLPKADVIHVGDVFRTVGYPIVDAGNGGTVKGTLAALQQVIDIAGPNTKILPGHGVVSTRDDLIAFRDMIAGPAAEDLGHDSARHDARAGHRGQAHGGSRRQARLTGPIPRLVLQRA